MTENTRVWTPFMVGLNSRGSLTKFDPFHCIAATAIATVLDIHVWKGISTTTRHVEKVDTHKLHWKWVITNSRNTNKHTMYSTTRVGKIKTAIVLFQRVSHKFVMPQQMVISPQKSSGIREEGKTLDIVVCTVTSYAFRKVYLCVMLSTRKPEAQHTYGAFSVQQL